MPPFLRVFVCIALRMTGIFSSPTSSFASIHPLFAGKEDPLLRSCWLINIVLRWLPMPASAVPLSLSPVLTAVVSTLSLVCLCQRPGGIRGWSSAVLAFDSTCIVATLVKAHLHILATSPLTSPSQ